MPHSSQSGVRTLLPIIFLLTALSFNLQVSGEVQANSKAMSWQENSQTKAVLYAGGVLALGIGVGYLIGWKMAQCKERCNRKHKLDAEKIVDTVDMEDVGEKGVFCRCWKSSKFPYCDGSHAQHNKDTGDNVGPLIIKGKPILGKED